MGEWVGRLIRILLDQYWWTCTQQPLSMRTYALFLRNYRSNPRPQVSRLMHREDLKWVGRCCLSVVTLGHAYPLSLLSVDHLLRDFHQKLSMKRNFFLPSHWPLFYPRTNQITAWSFRNPKSFSSHPLPTLCFEDCRSATIISAIFM